MIDCYTRRFRRYSPVFTRDLVLVAFAIPYHRNIPMDKYIHLPFLLLFPVGLLITRYPEILSIVPRIFCAYCLAVPCHLNTPTDNFSPLSSIHSSPVVHVFHNGLRNTIQSSKKILSSLLLYNTCLLALWMLSICLAIFVSILRHRHFDPIDST